MPDEPAGLSGLPCIAFDTLDPPTAWVFPAEVVPIRPRLVVSTAAAAVDAALSGLGVTRVLSYQAQEGLAAGRLLRLLQEFEPPPLPVSLVHAGQPRMPLKLRAFLDFAAPRLRAVLAADAPAAST